MGEDCRFLVGDLDLLGNGFFFIFGGVRDHEDLFT
jgi:hypothetical protein